MTSNVRMDLTGVVPVAVPLDPGYPTQITIPRDTHVMYWCALHPTPYPPFDKDEAATAQELLSFQRRLQHWSELEVRVDGELVPLLDDAKPKYGIEYWTVREPLSEGPHTLEISISYDPATGEVNGTDRTTLPAKVPPPTYTLPNNTMIPWSDGTESTIQSELIVADNPPKTVRKDLDPLWEKREVYTPREYEEVESVK